MSFKKKVKDKDNHTKWIDAYISSTQVLIEQKSLDVDLTKRIRHSDGLALTPFEQALRYYANLPHFENPRWIIISNFREFHIHDMNEPYTSPEIVLLEDLEDEAEKFSFLINRVAKPSQFYALEVGKVSISFNFSARFILCFMNHSRFMAECLLSCFSK